MSNSYQLIFMPYLAMREEEPLKIGDVEIWNFEKQSSQITDPAVRTRVGELLAMYRQAGRIPTKSAQLRGIGIVSVGPRDFRQLSSSELDQIQAARTILFLCCLAKNSLLGPRGGFMVYTSENFETIYQSFVLDSEYLSEASGVLIRIQLGGYKIGETVFTQPAYINTPTSFGYDEKLFTALVGLRTNDPAMYRRVLRAGSVFFESYYNTPAVDISARILLQAVAFEVLLELPEARQRQHLKTKIEKLANTANEKTHRYTFEMGNKKVRESRSLKVMWADRFYSLRNHIIHGAFVSRNEYNFLRTQHHLAIAPLMFTFVLKRLIDEVNVAAGRPREFYERLDWGVIDEGDAYEPRSLGFKLSQDTQTLIEMWLEKNKVWP